jgi:hypothetical protein
MYNTVTIEIIISQEIEYKHIGSHNDVSVEFAEQILHLHGGHCLNRCYCGY